MNLKNKFCRSVDPASFTPPLTKIPGSAPDVIVTTIINDDIAGLTV